MTPTRGRYFKTQPFFAFSTNDILVDNEEEFRVTLRMIVNEELVYELARSAHETRVLAPESLRHKLREHLLKGTQLNS
ncbi:hypothetical protein GCM10027275_10890 [Rhabdobacter roseus]|uniref:Putative DNA-binding transcriptional regulator YafY n=1 Tax=Rhabdobacter roseus TaxID=1655419 RepID=A0A840TSN8_9BACT|nr:hypothetical protein [Rhabdobacter roseus]MBB5282998.1 putative DNA-binding transcriptional regulator YafY [Rhabdobacter roseus]